MFDDSFGMEDSDRLIYARSSEGRSHLVDNGKTKNRYKVGDEVAIAGILKVSAIQPNRDGTVSYSFDRGFALHENMVEQMALKPYEKPIVEEVVQKPPYSGQIVCTRNDSAECAGDFIVGKIYEIKDGNLVGDHPWFTMEFLSGIESFEKLLKKSIETSWIELKS